MKIHELPADPGRHQKKKRLGRGEGSGHGKTSGKGHKGKQARSGTGKTAASGFEGGQNPLYRRLPKRGFNNLFRVEYEPINLSTLERVFEAGETVNATTLLERKVLRTNRPAKILGNGGLSKKLNIQGLAASKSAIEKIEKAGGKYEAPEAEAAK